MRVSRKSKREEGVAAWARESVECSQSGLGKEQGQAARRGPRSCAGVMEPVPMLVPSWRGRKMAVVLAVFDGDVEIEVLGLLS